MKLNQVEETNSESQLEITAGMTDFSIIIDNIMKKSDLIKSNGISASVSNTMKKLVSAANVKMNLQPFFISLDFEDIKFLNSLLTLMMSKAALLPSSILLFYFY